MTDIKPIPHECRTESRLDKTASLQVKQLTYPMASGPGKPGILHNISENGVCFSLATAYKEKDQLCLSIDLLGWQHHRQGVAHLVNENLASAPLTAIAEVVWCRKLPGDTQVDIGARFIDVFEDDLKALKTYLANIRHSLEMHR